MISRLLRALFGRKAQQDNPRERELRHRAWEVSERAHEYARTIRREDLREDYRRTDRRLFR